MKKIFLVLLFSGKAWGAACCGGGLALPALIVGDDRALLTTSYSYSELRTDVSGDGVWRHRDDHSLSQILRIEGAQIFKDRYQLGTSVPLVQRSAQTAEKSGAQRSSTGLGDVSLNAGYEYLPEWDYSAWRPRGLGFLQLTLPTGTSIYESDDPAQLDARGRGFWALGAGTALNKNFARFDTSLIFEVHRSMAKKTRTAQAAGDVTIKPGWGGTLTAGAGWNTAHYRLGGALTWTYEDPVDVSGAIESSGAAQRYATALASVSYLYSDDWSAALAYSDQTLFGSPVNSTLSRAAVFSLQRKWAR